MKNINAENFEEIFETLSEKQEVLVPLDLILDLNINPRTIDTTYAETMPIETPPVELGYIEDGGASDNIDLKNKLILVDGNHRTYSKSKVYELSNINAIIQKYPTLDEARIAAYKFNCNHGKSLTDREVAKGVNLTVNVFKKKNKGNVTLTEIAIALGITERQLRMYRYWVEVENVLGQNIEKSKADLLYSFINFSTKNTEKEKEVMRNNLKKFWELNKNLYFKDLVQAKKHFNTTGEIVSYEKIKIKNIMSLDDFNIGSLNKGMKEEKSVELSAKAKLIPEKEELSVVGLVNPTDKKEIKMPEVTNISTAEIVMPRKTMSADTMIFNALAKMQEEILDKVDLFEKLYNTITNAEDLEKIKKRIKEVPVIINNMNSTLQRVEELFKLD